MSEKMPGTSQNHNTHEDTTAPTELGATEPFADLIAQGLDLAYAANEAFDAFHAAYTEHQAQQQRFFQALSNAAGVLIGINRIDGAEQSSQPPTPDKDERSHLLESLSDRERAIAEKLGRQLPTSHAAYREHSEALGIPTELTLEAYEQLFTETLSDWHTRGILDYLATDLKDNGNQPLLTSVPNSRVGLKAHRQAAVAFGKEQPYATDINKGSLWSGLTPEQISGPLHGTAELRFRAVPSGATKALGKNTVSKQRKLLRSLQRDSATSQLGLQDVSPLEAVASWYALRQQRGGGPLGGKGVLGRTWCRHVTLPEKRLDDDRYVPGSCVRGPSEAILIWSWTGVRDWCRASVG